MVAFGRYRTFAEYPSDRATEAKYLQASAVRPVAAWRESRKTETHKR